MEVELWLEIDEATPADVEQIDRRLREWHAEGAEIRYGKSCFGSLTPLDKPYHFRVDLGQVDCITAIRELHARLYRFGAKVYVHFLH